MLKKGPKLCAGCRFSEADFYLYNSTRIAKAWPGLDEISLKIMKIFKTEIF